MQHEGIGIRAQLCDDEGDSLGHQTRDEGDISGEPVELGDDDRALAGRARGERCCELRAPVQGIGAFAGLDLGELGDEGIVLGFGEPGACGPLRLDPEARSALLAVDTR